MENDFLWQIQQEPEIPLHRLIYADWLEEQGDPMAEEIRDFEAVLADLKDSEGKRGFFYGGRFTGFAKSLSKNHLMRAGVAIVKKCLHSGSAFYEEAMSELDAVRMNSFGLMSRKAVDATSGRAWAVAVNTELDGSEADYTATLDRCLAMTRWKPSHWTLARIKNVAVYCRMPALELRHKHELFTLIVASFSLFGANLIDPYYLPEQARMPKKLFV